MPQIRNCRGVTCNRNHLCQEDGVFSTGSHDLVIKITGTKQAPRFRNLPGVVTIEEGNLTGTIFTIEVEDADGDTPLNISRVGTEPSEAQTIWDFTYGTAGAVTLAGSYVFDFETLPNVYYMNFTVDDPYDTSDPATLKVEVINVNEPPVCQPTTLEVEINEKLPVGTELSLILNATDPDVGDHVTYDITTGGIGSEYYKVVGNKLEISQVIDAGLVLFLNHSLEVVAVDKDGLTCSIAVTVIVHNVNEQHYVLNLPAELELDSRNTTAGTKVFTVEMDAAYIEDLDAYTFILESSSSLNGVFRLDALNGELFCDVSLQDSTTSQYNLSISVLDQPGLSTGPKHLVINIIYIKVPPYLSNLPRTLCIREDVTAATHLYTVSATDKDSDPIMEYELVSVEPASGSSKFMFITGRESCDVLFHQAYPQADNVYTNCAHKKSSTSDQAACQKLACDNGWNAYNSKGTGCYIKDCTGTDYKITGGLSYDVYLHYPIGYLSTIASAGFDYESVSQYQLQFRAKDALYWSESKNLTVIIDNVNEAPVFRTLNYTAVINEEQSVGTPLSLSPNALDAYDVDSGDKVTYQVIEAENTDYIAVNGNQLVIAKVMDIEANFSEQLVFEVAARDRAGLEARCLVNLSISDINDNTPVFDANLYSEKITENTYGGTKLLQVHASDLDSGVNGQFTYRLNGSVADTYFQIDHEGGELYVKHQVDYDKYPQLVFAVLAVDEGSPPLTGTTTVSIQVYDLNDETPTFKQDFHNLEIPCTTAVGTNVLTISATDSDGASDGNLTYYYLKHNAYFSIGASTGDIRVLQDLQCSDVVKYAIYFLAKDQGTPPAVSNVAMVRIDAFEISTHCVDIELALPLPDYRSIETRFQAAVDNIISPWHVIVYKVIGDFTGRRRLLATSQNTNTIVTVYALKDSASGSVINLPDAKNFVSKTELLSKLRKDMSGTPVDDLKTPEFSDYYVTSVSPTEVFWLTDTVEGIASLAACCLLVLGLLIGLIAACVCTRGRQGCCQPGCGCCNRPKIQLIEVRSGNVKSQATVGTDARTPPPAYTETFKMSHKVDNPQTPRHPRHHRVTTAGWLPTVLANRFSRRAVTPEITRTPPSPIPRTPDYGPSRHSSRGSTRPVSVQDLAFTSGYPGYDETQRRPAIYSPVLSRSTARSGTRSGARQGMLVPHGMEYM